MTGVLAAMVGSGGIVPQVELLGGFYADVNSPTATSGAEVRNDGRLYELRSASPLEQEQWVIPNNLAANYEVRATWISGSTPSGSALGSWLGCETSRSWSITTSVIATSVIKLEIRDKATQTIRAFANYSFEAEALGN